MNLKKLGKRNKQIGHEAERYYVNIFKELGFEFCVTARLGSRLYDNAKIDIINIPWNIQIKAGKQQGLNSGRELFNMSMMIENLFPPDDPIHTKPRLLIHKKPVGRGNKPTDEHEMLYMSYEQFCTYKKDIEELDYIYEKKYKFDLNSPFTHIVGITFEVFKEKIIKKLYL